MTGKTHLTTGLMTGCLIAAAIETDNASKAMLITGSAIGSLLPDIDISNSKMGSKVFPISFTINKIFGHRGLFHSPILYVALVIGLGLFFPGYKLLISSLGVGVLTHLILDSLNPEGIPVFYPISKEKKTIGNIRVGSFGEKLFFLLGLIVAVLGISTTFLDKISSTLPFLNGIF